MTDHTEMQIPSDILEAARLTYEGLPIVYDGWDEDEVILCIARAILAERNRCARIAIRQAPATQDFADAPLQEMATRIAVKIRSVDK